ncbi:serine phosphatase RsbU (regulator of sigma subunit) [Couchioplanes caeruleus]|uniref:Serine/threonine protein phosphatase n=3 Tax=Couchioplanes caeruleus TaxID=56438 RepID=A0A1K0GG81_9ACTN|nr:serine/threonine protein phosphatase [Couchioplanes caeruleus subsp. caeruleus]ROP30876.1 serine phosphatase RsbU (regulator of sigma subunit) [Couchioplanes caeruleus]
MLRGVTDSGTAGMDLSEVLLQVEKAAPVDAVVAVTRSIGTHLSALWVSFLVADMSGRALVRLSHVPIGAVSDGRQQDRDVAMVLPFDGGPQEQALRTQRVLVEECGDLFVVRAPVTQRGEAIGLLEVALPAAPSEATVQAVSRTAHTLAFVIIANRRHTDLFEWGQRTTAFTLAAEIQRRLLPASFACEADSFTLAAWLEPAASIGGDTFDYSIARDQLHLSITDAVGHGVQSALTATLCVGSLRNTRRRGGTLLEQAQAANDALLDHAPGGFTFATGLLGRLDLRTGVLAVVNAGHPIPLLIREATAQPVALPANRPFGVLRHRAYLEAEIVLQPGDRLVLVTDGMLERDAAALDLPARLQDLSALHAREVVRVLGDLVLEAAGPTLPDDACLLVLDWHGGHGDTRHTTAGADPHRASTPISAGALSTRTAS